MPGPDALPLDRASRQGRHFWTPQYGAVQQVRALQSEDRRDEGVPGAEPGPGAHPLGGAGARRLGLARRGGLQEARPLGSRRRRRSPNIRTTGASTRSRCIRTARSGRPAGSPASIRRPRNSPTSTEVPTAYGIGIDKEGTVWFTEMNKTGTHRQGRSQDAEGDQVHPAVRATGRAACRSPRTARSGSRSSTTASIARFDPKTETFKEFPLPHTSRLALRARHRARRQRSGTRRTSAT